MPELPEVETCKRGIEPHLLNQRVKSVIIRRPDLRWPIPQQIQTMCGKKIQAITRRGKYLLFKTTPGTAILHLGMSGRLFVLMKKLAPKKHDHVDICMQNGVYLRFCDPRRFGALLWTENAANEHFLLNHLGPEPLSTVFNTQYLYAKTCTAKRSIKLLIMDSKIVVGVGNIYANEALFQAGIHPKRLSHRISQERIASLVTAIKQVLERAIKAGGTTLRDFHDSQGNPGYFQQDLKVYGRAAQSCIICHNSIKMIRLGQRSTFYCPNCQK
ncbi:MAG: bifunctional DNA-formamidopyrimidine glycosylase/DNA-(apurinic or apyrimidinic site) lyase [Pseudomonadota bacterium]